MTRNNRDDALKSISTPDLRRYKRSVERGTCARTQPLSLERVELLGLPHHLRLQRWTPLLAPAPLRLELRVHILSLVSASGEIRHNMSDTHTHRP